jgi:hypothetical protein
VYPIGFSEVHVDILLEIPASDVSHPKQGHLRKGGHGDGSVFRLHAQPSEKHLVVTSKIEYHHDMKFISLTTEEQVVCPIPKCRLEDAVASARKLGAFSLFRCSFPLSACLTQPRSHCFCALLQLGQVGTHALHVLPQQYKQPLKPSRTPFFPVRRA